MNDHISLINRLYFDIHFASKDALSHSAFLLAKYISKDTFFNRHKVDHLLCMIQAHEKKMNALRIKKKNMIIFILVIVVYLWTIMLPLIQEKIVDFWDDFEYNRAELIATRPLNLSHIDVFLKSHPVFSTFNIEVHSPKKEKKRVNVLVIADKRTIGPAK